ncbi:MAG: NAD(+) diphosphatase [Firmicutes bacterium]|nr:NAD(+) diphosphatase [Bacillota bacterium]
MIQDLDNKKLYNEYEKREAQTGDLVFYFEKDQMFIKVDGDGNPSLPTAADFPKTRLQYLFRIEENHYFLAMDDDDADAIKAMPDITKSSARNLRDLKHKELAFAAATAYHLYQWYRDNQFCGRCGFPTQHGSGERMLKCPSCGNSIYPKIAPAVIVALTDGDRIMMTKYNGRAYKRYALIAGFVEIGETAEETVIREVREEVGLKAKNVRYYKSQPWGTEQDLLLGYFCELDGDDTVTMDEDELSTAEWVHRDDMNMEDDGFSLTREMMVAFQKGEF